MSACGTSLSIGADNVPVISYFDRTNGDLKVAHCNGNACSAAMIITLDSVNIVGERTSLCIGSDDLPVISALQFLP